MKKTLISTFFIVFSVGVFAQFHSKVTAIDVGPNDQKTVSGKLETGEIFTDLSWASRSSTACFPGTQNKKFTGNHVFFNFVIPPYSEAYVKLIPKNKQANMSLYGYQIGLNNYTLPPALSSCVTCEADHKWDYPKKGKTQDHTRSIRFNAIKNSYNVVVGVAGAEGLKTGDFALEVKIISKQTNNQTQQKLKMYTAQAQKGKILAYKGNLAEGVKINDLSWASRSSVACFPGTQNSKFTGNHIIYITEIPPRSEMFITIIPKNKNHNMSIYAYMVGTNNDAMVPNLASCVTCEADYKWDYPKKGKTQDHTRTVRLNAINNPYKVVVGVAGANGLTDGEFVLKIETK